ncbi:MAG: Hsp70 family protein [Myxococcota bacterium]|nr:Hsp70 family protein [Myxococcota bacterium]
MSQGPVLGIDLGTTNSVVAVADGGQARVLKDPEGRRMVPSVVSFHPDGHNLVGYDARDRRLVDAANTVYAVKRLIGRPFDSPEVARARERFAFQIVESKHGGSVVKVRKGKYALAEISAMVLRELRRVAEMALEEPCERAVVTVPANFNELQRSATKAAGKVAGLDVLRILNEPTAAALAYGYGTGGSEKVAVYDLGGGTFDITILELEKDVFEVLSTAGDTFLGGEDLDGAVAEVMSEAFLMQHGWDPRGDHQAFERLKAAGEWAKCQLSSEEAVELTVEELTHGRGGKALDLQFQMTRTELEGVARPWLERSFAVCDEALHSAGIKASELGSVVLVGGSTRMPLCREMVEGYFGKAPRVDIDPDMVVAQGAAIHGYALGGARPSPTRSVPKPKSQLGRVALKKMTRADLEAKRKERKRKRTMLGMPNQPAFAPPELPEAQPPPERPRRPTRPPPRDMPDLPPPSRPPGPPVIAQEVVEIRGSDGRMPKTTLDIELDHLTPEGDMGGDALDDLKPPSFAPAADPFADLAPDDPFAEPLAGGDSRLLAQSGLGGGDLDDPFGMPGPARKRPPPPTPLDALPPPAKKRREPTVPFEVERHAPPPIQPAPPPIQPAPMQALPDLPVPTLDEAPSRPPAAARSEAPPAAPARAQPVVPMPPQPPPLLMDVTPHSLGIETAGGFCRRLITKSSPVPTEQTRTFTTARDDQREVAVRVCQGESDQFAENEVVGEVVLEDLPPMARGELSIEVLFIIEADGTLAVEARDAQSGRSQRIHINLRGGLSDADIAAMRMRLESEELTS